MFQWNMHLHTCKPIDSGGRKVRFIIIGNERLRLTPGVFGKPLFVVE
jgi:hypothetical protein